jgi:hypothetical protein
VISATSVRVSTFVTLTGYENLARKNHTPCELTRRLRARKLLNRRSTPI